jgi:hypothetical protein
MARSRENFTFSSNNNIFGNVIFWGTYSHFAKFWLSTEYHQEDAGLVAAVYRNLRVMISGEIKISQEARPSVHLVL